MTMYQTPLEVVNTLRDHIVSSSTFCNREEFLETLENVQNNLSNDENTSIDNCHVIRCINLEGFDGVGKTTLANKLAQNPGFSLLPTLPDSIRPFRAYFDAQNEYVRRSYYSLCNIVASHKLASSSHTTVWVLDRYWPSTIAYQLAHQDNLDLASIENPLPWPNHLVRPSYVVYLYLNEDKRRGRIAQRHSQEPMDPEEQQLASDNTFRERLDAIYRRVENIHSIDADATTDEMAETILQGFENS